MIFKTWGKNRISRKPFKVAPSPKDRAVSSIDPKLKQIAYDKLAILRTFHRRLSQPKFRTKAKAIESFVNEFNSGILQPDGAATSIRHIGRATLYNWRKLYANGGLAALIPRYRTGVSTGKATFRPLLKPIEMKFPGHPRARGKKDFAARLRRHWKSPPFECPIRLSIFYSMPIPKRTKMPRRMAMLKHKISHRGKPNLNDLNAFIMDCMAGIVFRDHSQIIQFHSEKKFEWWPETRVLIKTLPG